MCGEDDGRDQWGERLPRRIGAFSAGASATLNFTAAGLEGVDNEFWAIDNVVVSNQVITPPTRGVPEPVSGVAFLVLPALLMVSRLLKSGRGPESI